MVPTRPFDDVPDGELAAQSAWLRRVAARLLCDGSAAEDVAQDVWLAAAQGGARGGRGTLAAYARNLARRWRRSEARRTRREEVAARPESVPGPDELAEALECQRVLVEELQALPPDARELLVLRTYAERTTSQIARDRGLPEATVRDRLRRAEGLLRARLDRRFGGQRGLWAGPLAWLPRGGGPLPAAPLVPDPSPWSALTGALLLMKTSTKLVLTLVPLCLIALRWSAQREAEVNVQTPTVEAPPAETARSQPSQAALGHTAVASRSTAGPLPSALPSALAVLVRDAATGLPAPHYAVALLGPDGERVGVMESDAAGAFAIPVDRLARTVQLCAIDHVELHLREPAQRELRRPTNGEPSVFEVELGPSYDLVLPPGAPPATTTAFLATQRFDADATGQRWFVRGAPLRAGAQPWVRFDPVEARRVAGTGLPAFVALRDLEGFYQAAGEAPTLTGHAPSPVFLTGGACGAMALTVTVEGAPPTALVDVHLIRRTDEGEFDANRDVRVLGVGPAQKGSHEVPYLVPGAWTIDLRAAGLEPLRREFEVVAGESQALSFDLQRSSGRSTLTVIVDSESGSAPLGLVGVVAAPIAGRFEGPADDPRAPIRVLARNPRDVGEKRMRLEGLQPGRYTVSLTGTNGLAPFDPAGSIEVDASVGEIRFTCRDRGVDWTPRSLRAVLDDAGTPVVGGALTVWADGQALLTRGLAGGEGALPPLAPSARVDVAVHAEGCRAVLLRDVVLPKEGPLVVRMEPGFGTVLVAYGIAEESVPLAGVRVIADGAPLGVTDELGRFLLTADRRPSAVRCELAGWKLFAGALDPVTGAWTSAQDHRPCDVLLRRE